MSNSTLLNLSPEAFILFLKEHQITKFHFVYDSKTKEMISSHNELKEIADFLLTKSQDFATHEGLFFELDEVYDVLHSAFVHRTNRGQSAGGVRFWQYDTMLDFITDGLRLAKGKYLPSIKFKI